MYFSLLSCFYFSLSFRVNELFSYSLSNLIFLTFLSDELNNFLTFPLFLTLYTLRVYVLFSFFCGG